MPQESYQQQMLLLQKVKKIIENDSTGKYKEFISRIENAIQMLCPDKDHVNKKIAASLLVEYRQNLNNDITQTNISVLKNQIPHNALSTGENSYSTSEKHDSAEEVKIAYPINHKSPATTSLPNPTHGELLHTYLVSIR
jgi:hypothetical protein